MNTSRVIDAIASTCVHATWQVLAVAFAFVCWRALVRPSAQSRYLAAALTLLSLPIMAALTFVRALERADAGQTPAPWVPNLSDPELGVGVVDLASQWPTLAAAKDGAVAAWPTWGDHAIVGAWALGTALLLLRQIGGLLWLRREVLRNGTKLAPNMQRSVSELAAKLGLTRVTFVGLSTVDVPFAFGWLRQVVVLPIAMATQLAPEQLELIVVHELMHLRRMDYLVNLLTSAVESVFFFHPAVWWLGARVREDRELACDADVIAHGADPIAYARALTELEASRMPKLVVAANRGDLASRIGAIVTPPTKTAAIPTLVSATLLGLALSAFAVACVSSVPPRATHASAPAAHDASVPSPKSGSNVRIAWLPESVATHLPLIEKVAAEQSVDPQLVALMVLVESFGDHKAVSPMGARGLMQLMPSTAQSVAAEMDSRVTTEQLFDPTTNVRLGSHLLAALLASHPGEPTNRRVELALGAYNAGDKAMKEHLEKGAALPEETQRYTRLLLALYGERNAPRSPAYDAWRARVRRPRAR